MRELPQRALYGARSISETGSERRDVFRQDLRAVLQTEEEDTLCRRRKSDQFRKRGYEYVYISHWSLLAGTIPRKRASASGAVRICTVNGCIFTFFCFSARKA